ncbi:unannotated protein [freshwater metagenome]|uniref:Unannotated protein n=1 Tax=freshwater metagenome TaxID=449393 RepID=A0A6J7I175_9ZZZZ|nr:hypothetical protein [Actinomycetota bacterium]
MTTPEEQPKLPLIRHLSDENSLSRWAHPARMVDIRTRHSSKAPRIGTLRFFTEDGFPEIYLALTSYTGIDGVEWLKSAFQNARTERRAGSGPMPSGPSM